MVCKKHCLHFLVLFLSACGGGGGSDGPSAPPSTPPIPSPSPSPSPLICNANQILYPITATSTASIIESFTADKAIDNKLLESSRWESTDSDAVLQVSFAQPVLLKQIKVAFYKGDQTPHTFRLAASSDGQTFSALEEDFQSSGTTSQLETFDNPDTELQHIQLRTNFTTANNTGVIEVLFYGCVEQGVMTPPNSDFSINDFNLDPAVPPGSNFDLLTWALQSPADLNNDNLADRATETELNNGFESEYFYTGDDGGMVFRSTIVGAKTSANTNYTRSELREMLRRGNTSYSTQGVGKNNWLLGYQPEIATEVGGRNGYLASTLAVNRVTSTGENYQIGRVIIGQIHAEDDEPIRLYYRKSPQQELGYIYFAHELRGGDDTYRMVLGPEYSNYDSQPNLTESPDLGIALDEIFSYDLIQDGARIDVLIRKGGPNDVIVGHASVDMIELNSGYDVPDEWMYFKAGAYSQNNSGNLDEYDQVTFYRLINSHE